MIWSAHSSQRSSPTAIVPEFQFCPFERDQFASSPFQRIAYINVFSKCLCPCGAVAHVRHTNNSNMLYYSCISRESFFSFCSIHSFVHSSLQTTTKRALSRLSIHASIDVSTLYKRTNQQTGNPKTSSITTSSRRRRWRWTPSRSR